MTNLEAFFAGVVATLLIHLFVLGLVIASRSKTTNTHISPPQNIADYYTKENMPDTDSKPL